jgi:hypothetical protein
VRELVQIAGRRQALTAVLDESVNSVPEAMEAISAQFAEQGQALRASTGSWRPTAGAGTRRRP